jgi:anti-anti-sigma factor
MTSTLIKTEIETITPKNQVTAANAKELHNQINNLFNSSPPSMLLINMEKVEFMDSAGLMVLVNAFNRAKELDMFFQLRSVNESVRIIFELTQLDQVFDIVEG